MRLLEDSDRALLAALPLPLAQAWRRSLYADSAEAVHQRALYVLEAELKFAASVVVVSWAARGAAGDAAREACGALVRPSLGHWAAMLRACLAALPPDHAARRWMERCARAPVAADLPGLGGRTVQAVLDGLPAYRNSVMGHGAGLSAADAEHRGPQLLAVARSVLAAMAGDDSPQLFARAGTCTVRLVGPTAGVQFGEPVPPAALVLRFGEQMVPLSPLWVFDPEEDDVLVLNKGAGLEKVEYLSYGAPRGGAGLVAWKGPAAEQAKRLLETVTGQATIDSKDVEALINETAVSELASQATGRSYGQFQVVRKVASGGQGILYEAIQVHPPRRVALKTLSLERAFSDDARRRLKEEAEALAKVEHPSIVPVYETGETDGVPWIAMKFIEGKSLAEVLTQLRTRSGPVTLADWRTAASTAPGTNDPADNTSYSERIITIIRDAASALAACHARGVIHRDVKPANLMLDAGGRGVLTDFGLARSVDPRSQTFTRQLVGTLQYLAPEALLPAGHGGPDARMDVYGLGATLYEALSLRRPFEEYEHDESALLHAVQTKDPQPLRRAAPWIARDLETVVMTAIERDRDRRYQSARDFADDLDRFLRGEPVWAKPAGPVTRARKWVRRHPTRVAAMAAALSLIVGIVLWQRSEGLRREQAEHQAANVEQEMAAADGAVRSKLGLGQDDRPSRLDADSMRDVHGLLAQAADRLDTELAEPLVQHTAAGAKLISLRQRIERQRLNARQLATFYRQADDAWFFVGGERDDEARVASAAAVESVDALRRAQWWKQLPTGELKLAEKQVKQLQQDIHQQLILLAALRAKPMAVNITEPPGPHARAARQVLAQANAFQPASAAADVVELFCALRMGEKDTPKLHPPSSATDHFFLGITHFWLAQFANNAMARVVLASIPRQGTLDFDDPMGTAMRHLRAACAIDPEQYWHHFTLAWALNLTSEQAVTGPRAAASTQAASSTQAARKKPAATSTGKGSLVGSLGALFSADEPAARSDDEDAVLGNFRDAELAMNACVALRPRYPRGYELRGRSMVMQALRLRQDAQSLPKESKSQRKTLDFAAELERRGRNDFDRSLELAPDDPIVHWARAQTFGDLGQHDAALNEYARAMELDRPLERLTGQTWVVLAREYLVRLSSSPEGHARAQAWGLLALANQMLSAKDDARESARYHQAAIEAVDRALQIDAHECLALTVRGQLELDRGAAQKALTDFEAALVGNAKYYLAASGRARSLEALGQSDAALQAWRDIEKNVAQTDWQRQEIAQACQRILALRETATQP